MSLEELVRSYFLVGGHLYDPEANFLKKRPGEEMSYSNIAFGLLGFIVEQVTGQAFNTYCNENIFIPLGMQSAGWMTADINRQNLAVQYDGEEKIKPYSVASYPDGALKISVKDYSKFLIAMMNGGSYNGRRLLKETTVNKMMPENPADNLVWNPEVMANYFIEVEDQNVQGHGGGDPGTVTLAAFNPENGNGLIIFMNGAPALISPSPFLMLEMLNYRSIFNRLAIEAGLY
jgi:CubicO group peptidase (beta-lactamase class C family)